MRTGAPQTSAPLELWAGVECTVNRVGDAYLDQIERSGHAHRLSDLDLIAGLGVRTVRYPALWERTAPDGPEKADWRWTDERLYRLRDLGVRPIVGLVHHGSGPLHTSLVAPGFVSGLAGYARAFAERYPWVDAYTPVNEPLTTARFAGLYGLWHPHGREARTFVRALLTQVQATAAAMRAVRAVNPEAQLVQTEDLGHVHSTPLLSYQADFENERRWLGWDLLCGHVRPGHALWTFLCEHGAAEAELQALAEVPCVPDVIGVNHYVTSERMLDERVDRYPAHTHGGNERHRYADIEAVRTTELRGLKALLGDCWARYQRPLAITEVHLGCTREEQLRWLRDAWDAARESRSAGADVRAVTAWSLFGAFDWDSLLTRNAGHYEPGVFDVRAPEPRPTALAHALKRLAAGQALDHPVLDTPGWWRRADRLLYAPPRLQGKRTRADLFRARPLLILGADSTLGDALCRQCEARGLAFKALRGMDVGATVQAEVQRVLAALKPWAVVNAAGFDGADAADEPAACYRTHVTVVAALAAACADARLPLLTFSSAHVFDGLTSIPYVEHDAPRPLSGYGQCQAEAEASALAACKDVLVVRTGPCFGSGGTDDFMTTGLRLLARGAAWTVAGDHVVSPTYVPHLVQAALDLLIDGEKGVWHLANRGAVTWAALARTAATHAGFDPLRVAECPATDLGLPTRRPRYAALESERGWIMPTLEVALGAYFLESEQALKLDRWGGDGAGHPEAPVIMGT